MELQKDQLQQSQLRPGPSRGGALNGPTSSYGQAGEQEMDGWFGGKPAGVPWSNHNSFHRAGQVSKCLPSDRRALVLH